MSIKKYIKGLSNDKTKEILNVLSAVERYKKLKDLGLEYKDIYSKEECENFTGLDKIYYTNKYDYVDYVDNFIKNKARVYLNRKWGFIDDKGNEITPIKYEYVNPFNKNKALVKLNGKYGYIDENGNEFWD